MVVNKLGCFLKSAGDLCVFSLLLLIISPKGVLGSCDSRRKRERDRSSRTLACACIDVASGGKRCGAARTCETRRVRILARAWRWDSLKIYVRIFCVASPPSARASLRFASLTCQPRVRRLSLPHTRRAWRGKNSETHSQQRWYAYICICAWYKREMNIARTYHSTFSRLSMTRLMEWKENVNYCK